MWVVIGGKIGKLTSTTFGLSDGDEGCQNYPAIALEGGGLGTGVFKPHAMWLENLTIPDPASRM